MATTRVSRKARLLELLEQRRPAVIDEAEFAFFAATLGASGSWLRRALRDVSLPLGPLVEGVRQESLESLERTLSALAVEYEHRPEDARQLVITAKDHARFALRRLEGEPRLIKEEMLLWMMTWLENPAVFAGWVGLRKRALGSALP
ncbi:MAG: hypothetical protein SFV54_26695 [Bryobacteraceae bacterium]|nr:hypothetical protein [Bryobacteraceae bacterium]